MRHLVRAVGVLSFLCLPAEADPPQVVDLGLPAGAIRGYATAISDNGCFVAGFYLSPPVQRVFRWSEAGGLEWFPGSAAIQYAGGVADDGTVAGSEGDINSLRLFRWVPDNHIVYGVYGDSCRALAVSRDGDRVLAGFSESHPLLWTRSGDLRSVPWPPGALNLQGRWLSRDGQWMTGRVGLGRTSRGMIWRVGESASSYIAPPPGWDVQDAVAADGDGPIWVTLLNGSTPAVARMSRGGAAVIYPVPGNGQATIDQTTSDGLLAIGRMTASPGVALWTPAGAFDLATRLTASGVDLGGRTTIQCGGISGDGSALALSCSVVGSWAYHPTLVRISGLRRACDADFDGDGFVTSADLAVFADTFNGAPAPTGSRGADFDGDGFIDHFDWIAFLDAFEAECSR